MAQWEYTHERIELPLGSEGRDMTPEAIKEMNRFGADGWEVCSILAYQQFWIVLLKREIPVMGMGGSGGSGGSGGPQIGHTPQGRAGGNSFGTVGTARAMIRMRRTRHQERR